MKLYISGKITDPDPEQVKRNLAIFNEKATEFRKQGYEVFNPGELEQEGKDWYWYLARDLHWIANNDCELYVMKGWKESCGASLEVEFAKLYSKKIIFEL